jgi:hypothetical protein
MRHFGDSCVQDVFMGSQFFPVFAPKYLAFRSQILLGFPNVLPWTQADEINASFGWSMRPGDAMRPLSLSLSFKKKQRKRNIPHKKIKE